MYYIYVMATNASCAIVIEDHADQVGSANEFTCNEVPKTRKASAITDFVINAIVFFNAETLKLQSFWRSN